MSEENLWFGTLAATVRVGDLPASRQVVAIELPDYGQWRVCGHGASDGNGVAEIAITGLPTSRIYAVAIDEWGTPFEPDLAVVAGDVIRPTQFLGWMYQVTSPGALPSAEPEWWNSMAGVPREVGTAMMQAVRHYQPIAHGPVSDISWVQGAFDPYWDQVVAYLRFDGGVTDLKGGVWDNIGVLFPEESGVFGGGAAYFGGAADLTSSANPNLQMGTQDYTYECFIKSNAVSSYACLFDSRISGGAGDTGIAVYPTGAAPGNVPSVWTNAARIMSGSQTIMFSEWIHYAVTSASGVSRLFLGGALVATGSDSRDLTGGVLRIGRSNVRQQPYYGYADLVRVTKGVARYTDSFTPPNAPFPTIGPAV